MSRYIKKEIERQYAEWDRRPWSSDHFDCQYDDSKEYPWQLTVRKTGRLIAQFRRKFAAQHEANQLDHIIQEVNQ